MDPSTINRSISHASTHSIPQPSLNSSRHRSIRAINQSSEHPILHLAAFKFEKYGYVSHFQTTLINSQSTKSGSVSEIASGWRLWYKDRALSIELESLVGEGTFGKVYGARILETDDIVAIKQVEIHRGYEFREVEILGSLRHQNICQVKFSFTVPRTEDKRNVFIVMEYLSCSLYDVIKRCWKVKRRMTEDYIMLLMYQLLKGLSFIHSKGICHRDLKPANILLKLSTNELKICDFGSAKKLTKDQPNATYICSRFYRAPEVILSCQYTNSMDMWSVGCIFAELYRSEILFKGATSMDQIIEIIKVLGTPSKEDLKDLGMKKAPFSLRNWPSKQWRDVMGRCVLEEAIDLISKMLVYSPVKRITAVQALRHKYFDRLRNPGFKIASGHVPHLFDSDQEQYSLRG